MLADDSSAMGFRSAVATAGEPAAANMTAADHSDTRVHASARWAAAASASGAPLSMRLGRAGARRGGGGRGRRAAAGA